ncbi:Hypothetical protein Cp262_0539 [Corynebacterium pseudotuberculosis]|nr:Hypothetical protein Cp262_0539 [Corynebacterium pseudotuberculosis]
MGMFSLRRQWFVNLAKSLFAKCVNCLIPHIGHQGEERAETDVLVTMLSYTQSP